MEQGIFTISLDFELYWGVRDKRSIEQYESNLKGTREAIPKILDLFAANDVHATWATVGMLFFSDKDSLMKANPNVLPTYKNEALSPYKYVERTENIEGDYHFAPALIQSIAKSQGQEIGSHTYSHYYCLEEGQSVQQFDADILSSKAVAREFDIELKSFVFPRNQWNKEYLSSLSKHGISSYRGNESYWIYNAANQENEGKLKRLLRLADAYVNISGHNAHTLQYSAEEEILNIPSSRFLRPYSKKLSFLDWLRLKRIKASMSYAAISKKVYHLWWHPHNFGANTKENIEFLNKILEHYKYLNKQYGFKSLNMSEIAELVQK